MKHDDDYAVCEMGGHSNAFYGRPEEDDRVYFDARTAAYLLRMEHLMECMSKCGIHNTEEFEAALELHKKEYV